MRVLFLDCFSGISGDMTVGALADLGVKPSAFEWELSKLDLGDFHMHFERRASQHITGIKFDIHEGATHREKAEGKRLKAKEEGHPAHEHGHTCKGEHDHGHSHEHGHHCHDEHSHEHKHEHGCGHGHAHAHEHGRSHAEIRDLIQKSGLSEFVKTRALSIFHRIAVAEGKIHGVPPEKVEFHEVGALDSIADVVLVCAGIEALGVEKIFVSPLVEGSGWIDCAHGKFPIPAPATLEILTGVPLLQIGEPYEFITPTGAAILAEFGAKFGPMPRITIEKIGYGLGTRQLPNRPNALRAVLGEFADTNETPDGYETDTVTRIETNLDDLSPEITGAVMERLLAAGALDVFFTPVQMKKNRPALQLSVLCERGDVSKIAALIFAETTAFGVRMEEVRRLKLARKFEKVKTPHGEITVKLGLKNGEVIQVAPEFESVRAASEKSGRPLREVFDAARNAATRKS
jgi:uncharacterized protein (TIGR00299 family) protein